MSAHAEKTVVINRPVESVFDFVLNGANNRLWRRSVLDVRPLGEAPYGVGSKFQREVDGPAGRVSGDYQITELEANRLIGLQVMSGPARWSGRFKFRPQGGGTELNYALDYEPAEYDPALAQQILGDIDEALSHEQDVFAALSPQERRVLLLRSDGQSNRDIARSMFVEEGTVHNYVFSGLSKLMTPVIQRWMDEEVGTLDELKAFLEKIA